MKKLLLFIVLILCCALSSSADVGTSRKGASMGGAAACSTDAVNVNFETNTGAKTIYYDGQNYGAIGQSFQCSAGALSSIELYLYDDGTHPTVEVRWGTSSNLTSYTATASVVLSGSGWVKFTFVTKGAVSASTTYYCGAALTSGTAGAAKWYYDTAAGYAGGVAITSVDNSWDMSSNETFDRTFRVYLCS
jgi:hypothetical protein